MSGAPKVRSMNVGDLEARPVLVPAGNKARSAATAARKPASKPLRKMERAEPPEDKRIAPLFANSPPPSPPISAPTFLKGQELLLRSNFSLNASCSSDASTDSYCSRASTGRICRRSSFSARRKKGVSKPEKPPPVKLEKIVADGSVAPAVESLIWKKRCAWVTPNTDPAYVAFHDEEWGVSVHDDMKLFELLVLSGALAELAWPVILSKRHIFREVFMNFDPLIVSKMNEKTLTAPRSSAISLLSEQKLRGVVENARLILKIVEEFGSFNNYCWSFVNQKPITGRFRYPRQVPVKTPKADSISKDLVKRGFRNVGPTVIYSFMQTAGMTNDHLISCYRFEECCTQASNLADKVARSCRHGEGSETKVNGDSGGVLDMGHIDLELARAIDSVSVLP